MFKWEDVKRAHAKKNKRGYIKKRVVCLKIELGAMTSKVTSKGMMVS